MAFIPTPNAVRVVIDWISSGVTFSNVLHFTKADFTVSDMQDLADALDAAIATGFRVDQSTGTLYNGVKVYDIRTIDGPIAVQTGGSGAGTQTGGTAPLNCAIVVTLRTNARGRTGRGRVFVTGGSDDALTGNQWSVAYNTAVQGFITDLRTAAGANGWTHVIRSIQANGITLNPAVTRDVVSFDIRSNITGSQRRRIDRL